MEKKETLKKINEAIEDAECYENPTGDGVTSAYARASAIGIRYLVEKSK